MEVLECDNAHQAPVPVKILDSTIRLTRSEDDLTRYSISNGSPHVETQHHTSNDELDDECIWSLEEDEIIQVF